MFIIRLIIKSFEFNLLHVSANRFLERFSVLANMDEKNTMLSKYIIEMALLEYKMMKFSPSLIASGAVIINFFILKVYLV